MKSNYAIALEILAGKWGNGQERRSRVTEAGYNFDDVQSIVNALVKDGINSYAPAEESVTSEAPDNLLIIDYDPEKNTGIQVNVLI